MIILGQKLKTYTDYRNLTCKTSTLIERYGEYLYYKKHSPDIDYIPSKKNIAAYALSKLPNNVNQETTHESTYTMEKIKTLRHQTDRRHISSIFQTLL